MNRTFKRSLKIILTTITAIMILATLVSCANMDYEGNEVKGSIRASTFPEWVYMPIGTPVMCDADFYDPLYYKYGRLVYGTGANISGNNQIFNGGSGSVEMKTGGQTGNYAEVKYQTFAPYRYMAFEMKWLPDPSYGANKFHFGMEPRDGNIIQGRMQYTVSTDEWQYENQTDNYVSFNSTAIIEQPEINMSGGNCMGWARMVIDTVNKEYVEFNYSDGLNLVTKNMKGIPLVDRGSSGDPALLIFTIGYTGAYSNEYFYTTDWCLSGWD